MRLTASLRPLVLGSALFLGGIVLLAPSPAHAGDDARPVDEKAKAAELIKALKSDSPEVRIKALEEAQEVQHDSLTSPLVKCLGDKELGIREPAIAALGSRTSKAARKKASSSLVAKLPRLAKSASSIDEHILVVEAIGKLGQPAAVKPLLDGIKLDTDMDIVRARLNAVAEIPDKKAIEGLIDFLARGRRGGAAAQRSVAQKALQYATGANAHKDNRAAGKDADRWRAWWRENEKHFDFEAVRQARAQAAEEAAEKKRKQREKREKREKQRKQKQERKNKPAKPQGGTPPPSVPD